MSYRIEEAFISRDQPHALRLRQRQIRTVVCRALILTRQVEGEAGDTREVIPDNHVLRKVGQGRCYVRLAETLTGHSHPQGSNLSARRDTAQCLFYCAAQRCRLLAGQHSAAIRFH